MKPLSPLFLAGLCGATLLSGCYMDRQPTMTLEDRMMASDKEIAEYEAAKKGEAAKKSESAREVPTLGALPLMVSPVTGAFYSIELSGQNFIIRRRPASPGANVETFEVLAHSESGEDRKILSVECGVDGVRRLVVDDKAGFVSLMVRKAGAESEIEVFRYDLHSALR